MFQRAKPGGNLYQAHPHSLARTAREAGKCEEQMTIWWTTEPPATPTVQPLIMFYVAYWYVLLDSSVRCGLSEVKSNLEFLPYRAEHLDTT